MSPAWRRHPYRAETRPALLVLADFGRDQSDTAGDFPASCID
jgi:hypothetical protein